MTETEYVYALQWRWEKEREWGILQLIDPSEEAARRKLERMKVEFPETKLRIVRRPVEKWEVVE